MVISPSAAICDSPEITSFMRRRSGTTITQLSVEANGERPVSSATPLSGDHCVRVIGCLARRPVSCCGDSIQYTSAWDEISILSRSDSSSATSTRVRLDVAGRQRKAKSEKQTLDRLLRKRGARFESEERWQPRPQPCNGDTIG